ncbi:MAG: DUF3526 domain-containing protein, partial [Acidobacteriota bacterium]
VQRGRASSWFLARAVAVTALALAAVLTVVGVAVVRAGAFTQDSLELVAAAVLYTVLWTGLLTATAVAARTRREAALAYGGAWVVLVILVPTLMAERALSSSASGVTLTSALEQRAEQYEGYAEDASALVGQLYAARPGLKELPAASLETLPPEIERHVYDWSRVQGLVAEDQERSAAERQSIAAAERTMAWSPAVVLTLAFERLAGRDLQAALVYRQAVVQAVAERADWVVERAWQTAPLSLADFESLVALQPEPHRAASTGIAPHLIVLLVWAAAAWGVGVLRVRRLELDF